jgi:hypothetical protein
MDRRDQVLQQYEKWNRWVMKTLWIVVVIGLVASAPLIASRVEMERSSNQVDIVFDYRDLLEISEYKANPQEFIEQQLLEMQEAGITGLAVYESTLDELEMSGSIKLFSAEEAALLNGDEDMQRSNRTYLLFSDTQTAALLEPIIREGFALYDIDSRPWSYNGNNGLSVGAGSEEAKVIPLDPDPVQLALLHNYGFRISARLSDARPYDHDRVDALLDRLTDAGVVSIIFAGKAVTGFSEDSNKLALTSMAELLEKHDLRFAVIEIIPAKQQKGLSKLGFLSDYRAVRLHSILEEEAVTAAPILADRFVLAVKDRNFRMIYLNARMKVDKEQGTISVPLANIYDSLKDPEFGAIQRIKDLGYSIGKPEPFKQVASAWDQIFKAIVCLGAIALITRMSGYFFPRLTLLILLAGLGFTAALYVLNSTLAIQALALLAAVSAPTAAMIQAISRVAGCHGVQVTSVRLFGWSLWIFFRTIALSLIGAVFTVALLNHISYILVLNQFRGVSVLHAMPIVLVALYVLFFHRSVSLGETIGRIKHLLLLNIRVLWVILAAFAGFVLYYYMTRTGNQGSVSSYEKMFRALLENTLGARPRTKELLTHPLMIIGLYLYVRYRKPAILTFLVIGTMGQLSVVDTFAHLHTPLEISMLRVIYGVVISSCIALVYVAAWELLVRSWRRWQKVFQE